MDKGWQVLRLSDDSRYLIERVVDDFEKNLGCGLYDYREEDDQKHLETTLELQGVFGAYGRRIIEGSLDQFRDLAGQDLHIQKYPYLRIARPGKPQDNIGIHRDTLYGSTPYEISVVIPLTSMPAEGSLHVIDGSQSQPASSYPFEAIETDVVKNSGKHNLGFVYLKKKLAANLPTHPVLVKVGECLAFPLSLVHGQEVNRASWPRFSVDIRLVNSLADIEWERTVHKDYWEPLCVCPVTREARAYYAAQ